MATVVETPADLHRPKKEVEVLKVLAEKVKGHVKWYSFQKRYGFISRSDGGGDIFVHKSVIQQTKGFPSLRNGEEVEFTVAETTLGIEATCVTGPDGQPLKGRQSFGRRVRTVSEPNREVDENQASNGGDSHRLPGRRSRGGGGRRRSGKPPQTNVPTANGTTVTDYPDQDVEHDTKSPRQDLPRQRRRPQPRRPRHRSAPSKSEENGGEDGENEQDGGDAVDTNEGDMSRKSNNYQPRRYYMQFRPRGGGGGGFRYANGMIPNSAPWPPYGGGFHSRGGPRRRRFGGRYGQGGGGQRRRQEENNTSTSVIEADTAANGVADAEQRPHSPPPDEVEIGHRGGDEVVEQLIQRVDNVEIDEKSAAEECSVARQDNC